MRDHSSDGAAATTRCPFFVLFFVMFVGRRATVLGGRVVANCAGLKRAIESQQQRAHRLGSDGIRFELLGDTVYNCESSIHITRSDSVVIVGAADGTSQMSFHPHRKRPPYLKDTPLHSPLPEEATHEMRDLSLFLNEGTLRLEKVIFEPICIDEGCDGTRTGDEEACGARFIRNSGELFVFNSVLGTGGRSNNCLCGTETQGRLVYSDGAGSSVVIKGSTLTGPSPCGGSAVAVLNGHITMTDIILTGSTDKLGFLSPVDDRDQLRISATIHGTVCESEIPEVFAMMKEMVEVIYIDKANCREYSGVHHTPSGSAMQNVGALRSGRGLSGSSDIVIDQGLLLVILTSGLIMLVVLLCLGDIWIRSHPRHRLALFFTIPTVPSPTGHISWKEGDNTLLRAPTQGRSNPFSNYAVSDDEISYVVPADVHETLEQSASRMQSISTDGQKVEEFPLGALNIEDSEIRHEDLGAALRGHDSTERVQQGDSNYVTSPGVTRKAVEIESHVTKRSREKLDNVEIHAKAAQIPDMADLGDNDRDEDMADVEARQLGALDDRPFESATTEAGLKSSHAAMVAGSGDKRTAVDHADATTSFERDVEVTSAANHGSRTALDEGTTHSETESLGAEQAERKLNAANSVTIEIDDESAVVSVDTRSNENARRLQLTENDIDPTAEAEHSRKQAEGHQIDQEQEIGASLMDNMGDSAQGRLAVVTVDGSTVRERNETATIKEDTGGVGEIGNVEGENTANIFDQENTARVSTAEPGIAAVNDFDVSPEQPQVVPNERVWSEAFKKLEVTKSMSSTAIEISPVASLWKLKPSRCSDSAVDAPTDGDTMLGEIKTGDKTEPSCPPSKYIVCDPMECSSPTRRESGGLDAHEVSPAGGVRTKPITALSRALGINRRLGIGDSPYTSGIVGGATVKASTYESPLSGSNLSYSPPSTEGEDESMATTIDRTRPFFDEGTTDPAHLRLREKHRGAAHSADRASQDSDDSPFAYLSLASMEGARGPFSFDLTAADENGDGGGGVVPETPASMTSSDDSDGLRRADKSVAAYASFHEDNKPVLEGGAVESSDPMHTGKRRLCLVASKKESEEEVGASSTDINLALSTSSLETDMDVERVVPNTRLDSTPPEQLVELAEYLLPSNEALVGTGTVKCLDNILSDMPPTPAESSGTPSFFSSTSSPKHEPSPSPVHSQPTQQACCELPGNRPCQPLSPCAGTSLSPERVDRSLPRDLSCGTSSVGSPAKRFEAGGQNSRQS